MLSLAKLEQYEKEGWLRSQIHPKYPLRIYNYTEKTQFEGNWNYITKNCRGMIVEVPTGKVIGRPFPKFFNLEESRHTPTDNFQLYQKVDGSLGILCKYQGELIFATRGSFTSDQAVKGLDILWKKYEPYINDLFSYRADGSKNAKTILFEIIYPANRVVVRYDEEKLIMLGAFDKYHVEMDYDSLPPWPDKVKRYDGIDYKTCKDLAWPNEEGFVCKFENGDRCKIKFEEYVRLHRILTCCNSKTIYDCLRLGKNLDEILDGIPDEFYKKIKDYADELQRQYDRIYAACHLLYNDIEHMSVGRKEFAACALATQYAKVLFLMKDGKKFDHVIWAMIEPAFSKL